VVPAGIADPGVHSNRVNACLNCGKDTELYDRGEPMCAHCSEARESELKKKGPFKETPVLKQPKK